MGRRGWRDLCIGPAARRALLLGAVATLGAAACEMPMNPNPAGACTAAGTNDFNCTIGNRTYRLHVGTSVNAMTPVPLVIDAHGFGGTAQGQQNNSGFRQLSDQLGFIVAYPQGVGNAFNAQGACCDFANTQQDVTFFRNIVSTTRSMRNIDPARIFATGFSNGGSMAHTMACTSADIFAAVAPVAFSLAGPGGPANTATVAAACQPVRPITMIQTHGTADTVANFNAGLLDSLPAPQSLVGWGTVNGCNAATGPVTRFTSNTTCEVRSTGCRGGSFVGLCTVQNAPHSPYGSVANTGMTIPQIVFPMLLRAATQRQ